jgi:hypothetical protein
MKQLFSVFRLIYLVCLWCLCGSVTLLAAESSAPLSLPQYSLQLSLNEFSILSAAEVDGLLKYGGSGDFKVTMAKAGNEVLWTVVIDNPRQMELLGIFVGEKTVKIVQGLNPNSIDPSEKIALEAIKSLTQKMEFAQKNPLWNSLKLAGQVLHQDTNWLFQTKEETYHLTGEKLNELRTRTRPDQPIVAAGYVKTPGEFELTSFIEKQTNTLELLVMSQCPFALQAESKLLAFLRQTNLTARPQLEVRYLFSKTQSAGKDVFGSAHGTEEVTEDLVQMAVRDVFPNSFLAYLRERILHPDSPWKRLAENAGLQTANLTLIEKMITDQRESMLRGEYETMVSRHGVVDASPSFFWESEPVRDLKKLEAFKSLDQFKLDTCSN